MGSLSGSAVGAARGRRCDGEGPRPVEREHRDGGQGNREGWNSQYIVWLFAIAAVSLVLFILIELWVDDPLVDLRLYRNATYSMASLVGVLLGFAMYGTSLLLPLLSQTDQPLSIVLDKS